MLYNIDQNPSEKYEAGKGHKDIIKEIQDLYVKHKKGVKPAFSQLDLGY